MLQLVPYHFTVSMMQLVSESVKTKQALSFLHSEKQTLAKQLQQVNASVESFKTRIARSEEQMKVVMTESIKSTEEDRHLSIGLEAARWELMDAEKEMKWLKSAVASSEREYEQLKRNTDKFQTELNSGKFNAISVTYDLPVPAKLHLVRLGNRHPGLVETIPSVGVHVHLTLLQEFIIPISEREKLEEELMELNREMADLRSESGEAAIQKLQDEIKDCKAILQMWCVF
ncbi:Histone mono-ubiquitination 2 isoform 3 [Tripterygium wilfordii]|uniref:E3 ubiquitin protein ligase n=1 Tax=Tripterygium wilfordii TaxID=458696 RepID=A0A7J7DR05_TRIWF|nr:Histone mono-ubiquitination 2 isoform 3 [Tripterygium wilfordii]